MNPKQDKEPAKRGRKPAGSTKDKDASKGGKKPLPFEKYRDTKKEGRKPKASDKSTRERRDRPEEFDKEKKFDKRAGKPYTANKGKDFKKRGDRSADFENDKEFNKRERKPGGFDKERAAKPRSSKPMSSRGDDKLERLNKVLANSGICSRREADNYITAGLVKVNNKVVTELGTKVGPNDEVKFNDTRLRKEKLVYVLLNKPKDFVTTMEDPHAKKIVMDLVKNACKERIYPVGRLDRNTTGVLLLTNDGDLTKRLTHPKYNKKKIYHVFLDKNLTKTDMVKIADGVMIDDEIVKADAISYVDPADKTQIGLEIHSGQNRVVRRIFESLDYKVTKLDRVYFAGLTKKNLSRGQWRFLTEKEIIMLKTGHYK